MSAITKYRTTDNPAVSPHAREKWDERGENAEVAVGDAWRAALPLGWPGVHNALYARYHEPTGLVLATQREALIIVWPLEFFGPDERDWIRRDVRRQGGEVG